MALVKQQSIGQSTKSKMHWYTPVHLPSKKALQPSDTIIEVILVDVSEQPIERPKKAKTALQRQKEAPHPESTGDHQPENQTDHRHSLCQ